MQTCKGGEPLANCDYNFLIIILHHQTKTNTCVSVPIYMKAYIANINRELESVG